MELPRRVRDERATGESSSPLTDARGRRLDYLRLSVTDRCNLRCRYCAPPRGAPRPDPSLRLGWDEMERLARIFLGLGVVKIRITGGEPLTRKGLGSFLERLRALDHGLEILLTTNGTLLEPRLPMLRRVGIRRLNVSIDSLRPDTYRAITGRSDLPRVLTALDRAEEDGFGLKVNVVVLRGVNDDEILDFVALTRDRPLSVRFIEPMPFGGTPGAWSPESAIDGDRILEVIRERHDLVALPHDTAAVDERWRAPGHAGTVGIIHGHSRRFCDRCSRVRVSCRGDLRTCLYGAPALSLRTLLRDGANDERIADSIREVVRGRATDGHEAESAREVESLGSMARIGG